MKTTHVSKPEAKEITEEKKRTHVVQNASKQSSTSALEGGASAGMPLFLQRSPLQRQPMEEEEEEIEVLQGKFTPASQLKGKEGGVENRTGLPNSLKAGLEGLSGMDLSNVRVHSNSSEPAQLNALAYTQGQDIYIGPGQEKHLPHEGWHVVQQMQGKVNPTMQAKGMPINDDETLEKEADVMGENALQRMPGEINQPQNYNKKATLIQRQTIQRVGPAALSLTGIGAALTSKTVSEAATMAGILLGVGAAAANIGAAIMPGQTGVQSVSLENGWMSSLDKQNLQMIIRYRIVNAYMQRFAQQNPDLFNTPEAIESAKESGEMLFPPDVVTPREAETNGSNADTQNAANKLLDSTVLESVSISVKRGIEQTLNANQKTAPTQEYIWSDSGEHTADWFGTVGAIEFVQARGTFMEETLTLNTYARQVPDLFMPLENQTMYVRQFRGGVMRRSSKMEAGLNDDLGINLNGSGPDIQEADNGGHGIHIYRTDWNWDDNTTHGDFSIQIGGDGTPDFLNPIWGGTPED